MKKTILWFAAICMGLGFTACSTDPDDAVSKHVYGENESPYLRTDTGANIAVNAEFRKGHIADQTISLDNYAAKIQKNLGMSVDQMLSALDAGQVVFYNIDTNNQVWNKTAENVANGWGYKSNGQISDTAQVATVTLDKAAKTLVLHLPADAKAGTSLNPNVGFAINNGKDFDQYVRFNISIAVSDPGTIIKTVTIPTGDYASYELKFDDAAVAKAINVCFGMTVDDFNEAVQDDKGDIAMYMVDANGKWIEHDYTANGIGFWCDKDGNPRGWGAGCVFFVETHDDSVGVGRFTGIASGTTSNVHFVYASKSDPTKYVEFVITANYE